MFPEMRRKKQMLTEEECIEILRTAQTGILGVNTKEYPSMTPLNFVYDHHTIYFHSAKEGYKIQAIQENPKVSFSVVSKDEVKPEEFSTCYESVMVYGTASLLEDTNDKIDILKKLVDKYCEATPEETMIEINKFLTQTAIICMKIDHVIGKYHK